MASRALLERLSLIRGPATLTPTPGPALRALLAEVDSSPAVPGQANARFFMRHYAPVLSYHSPDGVVMTTRRAPGLAPRVVATFADGSTRAWRTAPGEGAATDAQIFEQLAGVTWQPLSAPPRRSTLSKRLRLAKRVKVAPGSTA